MEVPPLGRDGPSPTDVPGVVALPPLIFLGFLVAATVLEAVMAGMFARVMGSYASAVRLPFAG